MSLQTSSVIVPVIGTDNGLENPSGADADQNTNKSANGTNGRSAPHPELEPVLQEEIKKIEPKIENHTVTVEEANHLHSLESRAHGYTEPGGVTAHAQSVAVKEARLHEEAEKIKPKIDEGTVTKEEATRLVRIESRAHGHVEKGSVAALAQSVAEKHAREGADGGSGGANEGDLEAQLEQEVTKVEPKIQDGTVTKDEASQLRSLDTRVHGGTEKGSTTAQAQSIVDKKESNGSQSPNNPDGDLEGKLLDKVAKVEPKIQNGTVTKGEANQLRSLDTRVNGGTEKGSTTAQAQSVADKKENSTEQLAKEDIDSSKPTTEKDTAVADAVGGKTLIDTIKDAVTPASKQE
ncbi:hypothetical protein GQ43DRAFT_265959 [Delitschia confertaspora ATCC 74209]|uniref:SMP domain-containing protein n=1 Tax=Delitschia confertaspora ATCC 74209 TaxID=1513339 RepID=A0A9P4MQS5_9PLEO|nr:hypothetical protein GQ43DRAFT_265959 [Delitschia confertaspora ATCC 74209]